MNLYHFTSYKSLLKILDSGELYFSDLDYSNDPSEGVYQREIIEENIKRIYDNNCSNLISFFNINTTNNDALKLFSISFSSDLSNIHNWIEYADYAMGAAITFNYVKLLEAINNDGFLHLDKVNYCENKLRNSILRIKETHLNDIYVVDSVKDLLLLYPFFKHPSYSLEKEYRIAFVLDSPDESSHMCDESLFYINPLDSRYVLNLRKALDDGIISKIVLGSNLTIYEKSKIKNLIDKHRHDVKLVESAIPIRKR